MLLLSLIWSSSAHIISFRDGKIKSGDIYERNIEAHNINFIPQFTFVQCEGTCAFEFLVFNETERSQVFFNESKYRPVCDSGALKFNRKSPAKYAVFQVDGAPTGTDSKILDRAIQSSNEIAFNGTAIWSMVLANCGEKDFVVTGTIKMSASSGQIDRRLLPNILVSLAFLLLTLAFLAMFYTKVIKPKPKVAMNHQLYLIAVICSLAHTLAYAFLFAIWKYTGERPLIAVLVTTVTRAAAPIGLLYVALLALQYPVDVPWKLFVVMLALYALSSYGEVHGIVSLGSRTTGTWYFGYGIPFADFAVLTAAVVYVLTYATRYPPEETSDEEKRKKFVVMLLVAFGVFFIAMFAVSVVRMDASITKTRASEWIAFMIHPLFVLSLVVCIGWFLWEFNPLGWKSLADDNDDMSGDLGLVQLEAESDGEIPAIEAKKSSGKKKTKSDDGFDLDDPFSTDDGGENDGGKLD